MQSEQSEILHNVLLYLKFRTHFNVFQSLVTKFGRRKIGASLILR